jgi:cell division protein FtsL
MTTKDIEIEKSAEQIDAQDELNEQSEQEDLEEYAPKKKRKLARRLFVIIAVCFSVYMGITIIYDKAEIARLRSETSEISKQIDEEKAQNDEYSRMLDSGEKEYMKKIAIDKLGYAYPEERRFYIVNQNK